MKTATHWLQELPSPYNIQALSNRINPHSPTKYTRLSAALAASFDWRKTPEGYEYWSALHDKLYKEETGKDRKENNQFRKLCIFLYCFFGLCSGLYLTYSFFLWESNPKLWDPIYRDSYILTGIPVCCLLAILVYQVLKKQK